MAVVTVLISSCFIPSVKAQGNLVVNGGFDTDASGWTLTNRASYDALFGDPAGSVSLYSGSGGADPTASQEISSLTPGQFYSVSGNYVGYADNSVSNSFGVAFDGMFLFETVSPTNSNWYSFSFGYTATSTSALLSLSLLTPDKNNTYHIDNISMIATPEPGSLCLIGLGGIVSAIILKNRRKC
jgi:hypothetical protein